MSKQKDKRNKVPLPVRVDPDLLRDSQETAKEQGRTLTNFVEWVLRGATEKARAR